MEFKLLYSGRLLGASRNNTRASVKHEIRRSFHPQLRRLWQSSDRLQDIMKHTGYIAVSNHAQKYRSVEWTIEASRAPYLDEGDSFYKEFGADVIAEKWARCGFRFFPLVTEEHSLRCALDIMFLRPEEPGLIIKSGDIDARLKTILDALRMPKNSDETGGLAPQDDEDPFFCLLEDDKLISEIKVTTENLLLLPKERTIDANDAFLVIGVRIWPISLSSWFNG